MSASEDLPPSDSGDTRKTSTTSKVKNTVRSQSRYPQQQLQKSTRARTKASGNTEQKHTSAGSRPATKKDGTASRRPHRPDTRQPELFLADEQQDHRNDPQPTPPSPKGRAERPVRSKSPAQRKPGQRESFQRKPVPARPPHDHDHRAELTKFFIIIAALTFVASLVILVVIKGEQESARQHAYQESLADSDRYESYFPSEVRLEIPYGMHAGEVCRLLEMSGVIGPGESKTLERALTDQRLDTRIRSGPILLPLNMSIDDVLQALTRGYWEHPIVTFYAGQTLLQIDESLSAAGYLEQGSFIEAAEQVARDAGLPFAEGFFLPEEYPIDLQSDGRAAAHALAEQMYERFTHIAGTLEIGTDPNQLRDIVIVASMIQRETANVDEMPLISGIIWKRLEEGIPLGIDATTRYEVGDWSGPIRKEDLEALTPYNTRRRKGLPPTGISNPGFEALHAAAHPETSPYYYYLHDSQADIHFAVTYEEHLANVHAYL